MSRRQPEIGVSCTEPGCKEVSFQRYSNQREAAEAEGRRKVWKCPRHARPGEVLSPLQPKIEWISEPCRQEPYGRFIGQSGYLHGPGFQVWVKDLPVGSRLKITAEILDDSQACEGSGKRMEAR